MHRFTMALARCKCVRHHCSTQQAEEDTTSSPHEAQKSETHESKMSLSKQNIPIKLATINSAPGEVSLEETVRQCTMGLVAMHQSRKLCGKNN